MLKGNESLVEKVLGIINDAIQRRYETKKNNLNENNMGSEQYQQAINTIGIEKSHEENLLKLNNDKVQLEKFLSNLYNDFLKECTEIQENIQPAVVEKIFLNLIKELVSAKLKIYDASFSPTVKEKISLIEYIAHEEMKKLIWTQAQKEFVDELGKNMELIFLPLLENSPLQKINLYSKEGMLQAYKSGGIMMTKFAPAIIYEKLSNDFGKLFFSQHNNPSAESYERDYALSIVMWCAISSQYVTYANTQSIDVYLPEGEIIPSSIFWNYELQILKLTNTINQNCEIKFHQLNASAKQEIALRKNEIEQICYDDKNWETVDFNQLTFSGSKVNNKNISVEDLKKYALRWKKKALVFSKKKKSLHTNKPSNSKSKKP